MAVRVYSVGIGGEFPSDVTVSASITGADIELVVDDTNVPLASQGAVQDILNALAAIQGRLTQDGY